MAETQQAAPGGAPQFQLKHRLALAMEIAGVDREAMAAELEVHKNTVANYMRGETRPSRSVLRVWALRCGVPFEWLLTGAQPTEYGPNEGTSGLRCIRGPWVSQPTAELADVEQVA